MKKNNLKGKKNHQGQDVKVQNQIKFNMPKQQKNKLNNRKKIKI